MGYLGDVLINIFIFFNIDFLMFGEIMKYVVFVVVGLNVLFEDMVVMVGKLVDVGIKGS